MINSFINRTWVAFTKSPQCANVTVNSSLSYGNTIQYCFYASDTDGNWVKTEYRYALVLLPAMNYGEYYFSNQYYRINVAKNGEYYRLNLTRLDVNRIVFQNSLLFSVSTNSSGILHTLNGAFYSDFEMTVSPVKNELGFGVMLNFTTANNNSPTLSSIITVYNDTLYFTIQQVIKDPSNVKVSAWNFLSCSSTSNGGFLVGNNVNNMYLFPATSTTPLFVHLNGSSNLIGTPTPYEVTVSSVDSEGFIAGLLTNNASNLVFEWHGNSEGIHGLADATIKGVNAAQNLQGIANQWLFSDVLFCEFTGNDINTALDNYCRAIPIYNDYALQLNLLNSSMSGWGFGRHLERVQQLLRKLIFIALFVYARLTSRQLTN